MRERKKDENSSRSLKKHWISCDVLFSTWVVCLTSNDHSLGWYIFIEADLNFFSFFCLERASSEEYSLHFTQREKKKSISDFSSTILKYLSRRWSVHNQANQSYHYYVLKNWTMVLTQSSSTNMLVLVIITILASSYGPTVIGDLFYSLSRKLQSINQA